MMLRELLANHLLFNISYSLMHRLKARAVEVPVRMYERAEGKSSITAFRAVYYMVKVTLSFLINCLRRFG
jgi:hypothetical protein